MRGGGGAGGDRSMYEWLLTPLTDLVHVAQCNRKCSPGNLAKPKTMLPKKTGAKPALSHCLAPH